MEKIRFSVIVPTYNGEKYLSSCIDSILDQSYGNFEIIIADDGSTDGTPELAAGFNDERIRVFRKPNEGPLMTRVFAVSKARGEYCVFVDCDDYIDGGYFERLDSIIDDESCDIVVCSFRHIGDNGVKEAAMPWNEKKVFYEDGLNEFRCKLVLNSFLNSMCTKTIRTSLLKDDPTDFSRFSSFKNGEDLLESLYPVFNAERIVYLPESYYNYRENDSSITHRANPDMYKSILAVREKTFGYLIGTDFFDDDVQAIYANNTVKSLVDNIKATVVSGASRETIFSMCKAINSDSFYMNSILPKYRKSASDKRTRVVFGLFRRKRYGLMLLLIKCFFEVKGLEKKKHKRNN